MLILVVVVVVHMCMHCGRLLDLVVGRATFCGGRCGTNAIALWSIAEGLWYTFWGVVLAQKVPPTIRRLTSSGDKDGFLRPWLYRVRHGRAPYTKCQNGSGTKNASTKPLRIDIAHWWRQFWLGFGPTSCVFALVSSA